MSTAPLSPDELLTTTRAVRRRLDLTRPVPPELVRECLKIAVQAPSGSNLQAWHWVVVTQQDVRAAIGEFYRRAVRAYLAAPRAANPPHDPESAATADRVRASAAYLGEHMGEVPVLVVPCVWLPPTGLPDGNQAALWGSLLPAVWSYMLAARARGLGTAWTTLHLAYEREVADLLGLPDRVRQAALIPTAYYTGETFHPAKRKPLDEVVHLDHW